MAVLIASATRFFGPSRAQNLMLEKQLYVLPAGVRPELRKPSACRGVAA